jgi:tetratricopeptide (TPR) repeat protein
MILRMSNSEIEQEINHLFHQACQLKEAGKWSDAIELFGEIIGIIPRYAPIYVERGLLLTEMGRIEAAKHDFELAIKLNPQYGLAYYGRGWVRHASGDFKGELDDARHGLLIDKKHAGWYYRRIGSALSGMGRDEEAVDAYDHAIELNGEQEEGSFYNRGISYSKMGKYDLALADFNRCLELDPDWSWAFAERGQVYLLQNQLDKAIEDFTKAIKYNPNYSISYFRRAEAYEKKGDKKLAKVDYKLLMQMKLSQNSRKQVQERLRKLGGFWGF